MFAVAASTTLEVFTAEVNAHQFSRVPVYGSSMDEITGIAFSRDLLGVKDDEAATRTVAELQRPCEFIPETKKVNELLREMQQQKQHMSIVIDEYGGVAGLVTIEDLLEAIVGNIEDEHDEEAADETPIAEPEGTWLLPGSFEVSRLRDLFEGDRDEEPCADSSDEECLEEAPAAEDVDEFRLSQLVSGYEATTVGGLVSEIAGHIPLPGEVVEDGPLRLEVIASTDRLVERVRVGLKGTPAASEPE
jgi:putative hemolysin